VTGRRRFAVRSVARAAHACRYAAAGQEAEHRPAWGFMRQGASSLGAGACGRSARVFFQRLARRGPAVEDGRARLGASHGAGQTTREAVRLGPAAGPAPFQSSKATWRSAASWPNPSLKPTPDSAGVLLRSSGRRGLALR